MPYLPEQAREQADASWKRTASCSVLSALEKGLLEGQS